jgi:hypothetical protein
MTDKAKERIQRACLHLALLRVIDLNTEQWTDSWMCADCEWTIAVSIEHRSVGMSVMASGTGELAS